VKYRVLLFSFVGALSSNSSPRYFKTKAPRKRCHKTHREPTSGTEKVPPQGSDPLGSMFSIVVWLDAGCWLAAGWLIPSRPSPLNIILLTPFHFIVSFSMLCNVVY